MIKYEDISNFFDAEAEASAKSWNALMQLSVKDRIRKRKTIRDVYLEKEDIGISPEGENQFRVSFKSNLSDFKEGECLFLHKEDSTSGIKCTLNKFEEDNTLIISVFRLNLPSNLDDYYNTPLLLDKDLVDLREHVYSNFLAKIPSDEDFLKNNIINTSVDPTIEDIDANSVELDDTIENFGLKFTEKQRESIVNSMSAKDYYLIQGPPGTGKSFVLSVIILEEVLYAKHKVVVIGPNHMAINNALEAAMKLDPTSSSFIYKVGQSYNEPKLKIEKDNETYEINKSQRLDAYFCNNEDDFEWVIGLTPHSLYTSRAHDLECDTLIIDEAGQMTIPLALMGMMTAKKVILAGDHKQLPPIITSDEVPEELKKSVFEKLMTGRNCTMLDVSFRMCEPICNFVSDLFYDGNVKAMKSGMGDKILCSDPLYSFDTPIIFVDVDDCGEQTSDLEAECITTIILNYISFGLEALDIASIAPFRAQAANIRRHLKSDTCLDMETLSQIAVDTVDKMQGQEREVIIYSMTAGDPDYMADMGDFLYNPNKLNVAFSRAKSKLIIVGNLRELKQLNEDTYPHIKRMIKYDKLHIIKYNE